MPYRLKRDRKAHNKQYGKRWRRSHREHIHAYEKSRWKLPCRRRKNTKWAKLNAKKLSRRYRKSKRCWRANHPGYFKRWLELHPVALKSARKQTIIWQRENADRNRKNYRVYRKRRYRSDFNFRITASLRSRLCDALKQQDAVKSSHTFELLGCSISEFRRHIERQFLPGMFWSNYGKVWELDHVRACRKFDLTKPEDQQRCFHFTNFQPLGVSENRKKGGR